MSGRLASCRTRGLKLTPLLQPVADSSPSLQAHSEHFDDTVQAENVRCLPSPACTAASVTKRRALTLFTSRYLSQDYLSTTIPEILCDIFALVQAVSPETNGVPICKALLPFQRRELFRHVELNDVPTYQKFIRLVTDQPSLGGNVRIFKACVMDFKTGNFDYQTDDLTLRTFAALTKVTELSFIGASLVDILLDPEHSKTLFQTVRCLTVVLVDTPTATRPLDKLNNYLDLRNPELTLIRPTPSASTEESSPTPPLAPLTRIRHAAFFSWSNEMNFAAIASRLQNVERLGFAGYAGQLCKVLNSISRDLNRLDIAPLPFSMRSSRDPIEPLPFSQRITTELRRFRQLETLEISADVLTDQVYSNFPPNLRHLIFADEALPSVAGIRKLVDGPRRIDSLRHIILEQIEAKIGQTVNLASYQGFLTRWRAGQDQQEAMEASFKDWKFPKWTPTFPRDEAYHLLSLLRSLLITVDGSFIRAFTTT